MIAEDLFPGFESRAIETAPGVFVRVRTGGRGDPLLRLHGHPQTSAIRHEVAPVLPARIAHEVCRGTTSRY